MRKNGIFVAIILLFAASVFSACGSFSPDQDDSVHGAGGRLGDLEIVYTANVSGEIEPCGCRGNPSGGLDRRWNAQAEKLSSGFPKKKNDNALTVDSGDLFYRGTAVPFLLSKQWDAQADAIAEGYRALGVEFFTPGDLDFSEGMKKFQELSQKAGFKVLSANIFSRDSETLVFEASTIIQRAGKRIALIGVIDEEIELPEGYLASPHAEAVARELKKLRHKVDLVILLSHLGLEKDLALAKAVPGIDVIVGSHSHSFLTTPEKVGDTIILHSSFRGQHLGVLRAGINTFYQLDDSYLSRSDRKNPMDHLIVLTKKKIAELNSKMDSEIFGKSPELSLTPVPVARKESKAPGTALKTFVQCASCHARQHEFVKKTRHSNAYLTLLKLGQHKNLECLQCHTLGQGLPGGYTHVDRLVLDKGGKPLDVERFARELPNLSLVEYKKIGKAFINVQCENCHSVPLSHPKAPSKSAISKVETQVCLACHTAERAPQWYRDGRLNSDLISEKHRSISCPR